MNIIIMFGNKGGFEGEKKKLHRQLKFPIGIVPILLKFLTNQYLRRSLVIVASPNTT